MKPLLLLDVDGPLNPYAAWKCPPGYDTHRLTVPGHGVVSVRINPGHGAALRDLSDMFELVWATSWGELANTYLCPLLGLPDLPVVPWTDRVAPPRVCWKTPDVAAWTGGRTFAWVDDDISRRDRAWLHGDPRVGVHLVRHVSEGRGLTSVDFDDLANWAANL